MICPRCRKEISDNERLCPYCHEIIGTPMEFNNYRKDGFIQLKKRIEGEDEEQLLLKPKEDKVTYFKISEMNIFTVAVIFILLVATITIFGVKALQTWSDDTTAETTVPIYTTVATAPSTEATIRNEVKEVTIKNLYGSWKSDKAQEREGHAVPYFSFGENGNAQYNYGSLTIKGSYKDFSKNKENIVYITIDDQLNGLYYFDVTGNETDGYTLTLTDIKSQIVYTYVTAEAKSYKLDPIKDYKIDKKIIGAWKSEDGSKGYTFTDDGRFSRTIDTQDRTGVWTLAEDNLLELKYMEYSVNTIVLNYDIFEGNLVINNEIYYKTDSE